MRDYWHYEWCPACGLEGIQERIDPETLERTTEPCEPCDGTGRMKVPNGYELRGTPTPFIYTTSSTGKTSKVAKVFHDEQGE